ncbi:MAG: hypothetical protein HY735_10175 [Verrucomicrobia bacterium]|nr:hypothetical protein [Verrucomicrobiota bacterium]
MVLLLLSGVSVLIAGCSKPAAPAAAPSKSAAAGPATNVGTAKTESMVSSNELATHKAVFERRPGGRDPFFPTSTRLPKVAADGPSTNQPPRLPLSSYIKLTGIRPSKTRPLAMINQTLFETGERGSVTVFVPNAAGAADAQKVLIRCLEIRDDCVLITVEGEPGVKQLREPAGP